LTGSDLNSLDLDRNTITALRFVARMPSLSELYASGNPVADVPAELLGTYRDNCLPALRAYWRDLDQAAVRNEVVKVLLVGNGCVGKTTLAHCLAHGHAPHVPVTERTHGIELQTVKLELSQGGHATLHLWDFGGQERYHAMHRLFVHRNALYLLLWAEATDEAADETRHPVGYWLDLVQRLAPGAEVLLVKNQIDRSNKRGRPEGLEKRELGPIRQVEVSALKYWGIETLNAALGEMVQGACRLWGYLLPKSWHEVRTTLETWRWTGDGGGGPLRSLSRGRFEQLCLEHGVSDVGVLLGFLHDTGEVYHRAGRFDGAIVLDQNWFIDALYRLFDRTSGAYDTARRLGGELKGADLRGYWPDQGEAECETYFAFLLQTGLAFELGHTFGKPFAERTIVVPALLPDANDERLGTLLENWAEVAPGESWLRLTYPVLHRGLVERIIVELSGLSERRSWWRDGIIVRDPLTECTIYVSATPQAHCLELRLRKGRHEEAFARVRTTLDELLRRPPERVLVSNDGKAFVHLEKLDDAARASDAHVVTEAGRVVAREAYDRFVPFARPSRPGPGLVPARAEPKPTRLFLSWSRSERDRPYLEALETHLKGLKRLVAIDFWHGGNVFAGAVVADEMYKRLEVADIVLLLISRDFMASDECFSTEMVHALKKYDEKRGAVVPILLRPEASWAEHRIGQIQALPRDGRAISQRPEPEQDEAWVEVIKGLRALCTSGRAG
jgi:internalin A